MKVKKNYHPSIFLATCGNLGLNLVSFLLNFFLNFRIFLAKKLKKNTRFSQFEKKNQHLIKIRPEKNPGFTVLTTMCFQFSMLNGFRVVVDVEGPFN
jgi:hypothetical protein